MVNSREYWEERYKSGRNSGARSYGRLAAFKADFINHFPSDSPVDTSISDFYVYKRI